MKLNTRAFVASFLLATGLGAGSASAVTYNFLGGAMPAGLGYGCQAGLGLNVGCSVTFNAAGLGVAGPGDNHEDVALIDSYQGVELLIISFGRVVRISQVMIGLVDLIDDFTIETAVREYRFRQGQAPSLVDLDDLTSYIRITALPDEATRARDFITLAGVTTSAVSLPASSLLLLGGLGGLALWRKKKAA